MEFHQDLWECLYLPSKIKSESKAFYLLQPSNFVSIQWTLCQLRINASVHLKSGMNFFRLPQRLNWIIRSILVFTLPHWGD